MSNYEGVIGEINRAAEAAGRNPQEIKLVAVTKTMEWNQAKAFYESGQRDFAENRVQNALVKMAEAPEDCKWHLIGTLQSNKVKKAIGRFVLIHSVDSLDLLKKISDLSIEADLVSAVLLQVNISGELSKHGMTVQDCMEGYAEMLKLPGVDIQGLMTMAPLVEDEGIIRRCFAGLRELLDRLNKKFPEHQLRELSMGMSHDFKIAIAEGATLLRIGSALQEKG